MRGSSCFYKAKAAIARAFVSQSKLPAVSSRWLANCDVLQKHSSICVKCRSNMRGVVNLVEKVFEVRMHDVRSVKIRKVLIVDDMGSTSELLQDMLRELGFENVSLARNGNEGLQRIREHKPDLIISDQLMDGMTGLELLEVLRANQSTSTIPFIMVSAVRDGPAIDAALDSGVDDYIAKPISMGLLRRTISDVYNRRVIAT